MKKTLLIATAFCASTAFAGGPEMVMMPPSPFDGFYLGGFGSFHHTGFDIDGEADLITGTVNTAIDPTLFIPTAVTTIATNDGGDSSTDGYYGIQGGWGRVFNNRWYAGIVGFAEFGDANGSVSSQGNLSPFVATGLLGQPISGTYASETNSARIGTDYGVAAKLGVLLSPTTLAYAKLGAVWANIKASVNAEAVDTISGSTLTIANGSNSETEAAFLWGFGAEQFIYRDVLSIYAEYTYASFGSVNVDAFTPVFINENETTFIQGELSNSVSADFSAFTGGLNIHFGRDWI